MSRDDTTGAAAAGSSVHAVAGLGPVAVVGQTAAALAAGMGVGRFVYTPILPVMHAQAGLPASAGATLATANYVGYFAGALLGMVWPALTRSRSCLRTALAALVLSLAGMAATRDISVWIALRSVAGVASALIFVIAVSYVIGHVRGPSAHLAGWAFGGVGAGIALSGVLVLMLRPIGGWQAGWLGSAGLAALLGALAWGMAPGGGRSEPGRTAARSASRTAARSASRTAARSASRTASAGAPWTHRWFAALLVSYSLEGVGYIIAGTFLVAAIEQGSPAWVGSGAWILVGLAAVPSSAAWALAARRWQLPSLLVAALVVQALGMALPAVVGGVAPALLSALAFGGTFMGVGTLTLGAGALLRVPRSVALLTGGYSAGQILGPLVAVPLLHHGYQPALLSAAVVVLCAASAAMVLRTGFAREVQAFEHQDSDQPSPGSIPTAQAALSDSAPALADTSAPSSARQLSQSGPSRSASL